MGELGRTLLQVEGTHRSELCQHQRKSQGAGSRSDATSPADATRQSGVSHADLLVWDYCNCCQGGRSVALSPGRAGLENVGLPTRI